MRMIVILFFLWINASAANIHQVHLHELNKEFPYGLLTDDFGVLSILDLKINTCIAGPIPFSKNDKISPYPYWQCFEIRNSKINCELGKYDPQEKDTMSMLVVSSMRNNELHEFISRRPITYRSCQLYIKDWQKLTKNEKYICISGADHSEKTNGSKVTWTWIFGRYKTKKGCDSYFQGECTGVNDCEN